MGELTSSQMNALDTNVSNALDAASGHTATLASTVSVTGALTLASGASIASAGGQVTFSGNGQIVVTGSAQPGLCLNGAALSVQNVGAITVGTGSSLSIDPGCTVTIGGGTTFSNTVTVNNGAAVTFTPGTQVVTSQTVPTIEQVTYALSVTLNCSLANVFQIAPLTGTIAITLTNFQLGQPILVIVQQDSTGGRGSSFAASGYTTVNTTDTSVGTTANEVSFVQIMPIGVPLSGGTTYLLAITSIAVGTA